MAWSRWWVSVCITCLSVAGCAGPSRREKPMAENTSPAAEVFRKIDPTGAADRNIRLGQASEAIKERLDELDVDGFNQTVAEYRALAQQVNAQITALANELRKSLTTGIDDAELGELSRKLQDAADEASAAMALLDPDGLNRAVSDTHRLVTRIDEKVEQLDIEAANRLITNASSLRPDMADAIRETSALVNDLRQTIAGIDSATASINRAFWLIQIVLVLSIVPILLLSFCALVWLRHRPGA